MAYLWAIDCAAGPEEGTMFTCTMIAPGIAYGPAVIWVTAGEFFRRQQISPPSVPAEIQRFDLARRRARRELDEIASRAEATIGNSAAAIFTAHGQLLDDPKFFEPVVRRIKDQHMAAELAVHATVEEFAGRFAALGNGCLAARAEDFAELGDRLLRHLRKEAPRQAPCLSNPGVLIADHLGAADIIALDRRNLLALVMIENGPTSHAALLASALGVPVVAGVPQLSGRVRDGDTVIVDANHGYILVNPSALALQEYRMRREIFDRFSTELAELRDVPAVTPDGRVIHLGANVGLLEEVPYALAQGAESVGLLRTEYFFLAHGEPPSEEEQYDFYTAVVRSVAPRRVTFRTFDLGCDKSPSASSTAEANPMLGCRGIRLLLERRDLFVSQIRAMLRASRHGPIRIMFPLITSLTEFQETMLIVRQIEQQLRDEGMSFDDRVPYGCMIETPAAATISDILASEVEFLSIGSNDLIQYTLAADRTNPRVAHIYEPLHLAVLRMMRTIIRAGHRRDRTVSLCGEMAADPICSIILLGMGVDELSMSPVMIPAIKQIIRGVTWAEARDVARGVLRQRRAKDVAAYLEKMMESRFPRMMSIYGSDGSPMAPASEPEHLIPAADESPGVLRGDRKEPVEAGISYE